MNIYFSASIMGGRQLAETYFEMVQQLKKYGKVLTEHIAHPDYAKNGYEPADVVYKKDVGFLDASQVVVAEVSVPSLGVGYELAYAESKGLPVYCFYDSRIGRVSSMVLGNPYFKCFDTAKVDFAKKIEELLGE
ncbi:MAG: nucleoside 2-deoxyribosyltransferase [Clostridia bacterium]|nr:nucleoside 2-deoxyribosyltransferase [Clostridia bacterium]